MLTRIVPTQRHVVHLPDIHQLFAARIADGALNVFFHLVQQTIEQAVGVRLQSVKFLHHLGLLSNKYGRKQLQNR